MRGLWSSAASRISTKPSRLLLQGAPSAPSATCTPRGEQLGDRARCPTRASGSTLGQCTTCVPRVGEQSRARRRVSLTQWASVDVRRRRGRASSRYAMLSLPARLRTSAISARFSLAWVWMRARARPARARRPRAAAPRCTTARSAARRRSAAGRRRRRASARAARRPRRATRRVVSRRPGGHAVAARPSSPCRRWRAGRVARRRRRSRRCGAPCPCRGSRWCRRASSSARGELAPRRASPRSSSAAS